MLVKIIQIEGVRGNRSCSRQDFVCDHLSYCWIDVEGHVKADEELIHRDIEPIAVEETVVRETVDVGTWTSAWSSPDHSA